METTALPEPEAEVTAAAPESSHSLAAPEPEVEATAESMIGAAEPEVEVTAVPEPEVEATAESIGGERGNIQSSGSGSDSTASLGTIASSSIKSRMHIIWTGSPGRTAQRCARRVLLNEGSHLSQNDYGV